MKRYGKYIILLHLILMSCSSSSQPPTVDEPSIRPAANAGRFYEGNDTLLSLEIDSLLKGFAHDENNGVFGLSNANTRICALIVPHAGYFYSGRVAASAFSQLDKGNAYKRIFLIGPSHHIWLDGASVAVGYDFYETPLGHVPVDTAICQSLIDDSLFVFNPKAHDAEHCIEVQLPFLQRVYQQDVPPIVPIVVSTNDYNKLSQIAIKLKQYFNEDNLFIINSDFSHYPSYADANLVDARTCKAILTKDPTRFIKVLYDNESLGVPHLETSACGDMPILILLMMLDEQHELTHIMYQNSGDSDASNRTQVVGYHSFMVTCPVDFTLTEEEKAQLKAIAYESLQSLFQTRESPSGSFSPALKSTCGAFVTIKKNGQLRGCVGRLVSDQPLYQTVSEMAQAAASSDPRFPPLSEKELKDITLEISVLTPLRQIHGPKEFILGKHGLFIRKGEQSGTFLPQVAAETNWSKSEFFGHCSQDKAGLGWNGWKTAELYTFEAIVF